VWIDQLQSLAGFEGHIVACLSWNRDDGHHARVIRAKPTSTYLHSSVYITLLIILLLRMLVTGDAPDVPNVFEGGHLLRGTIMTTRNNESSFSASIHCGVQNKKNSSDT
jgi:hypothetical protein